MWVKKNESEIQQAEEKLRRSWRRQAPLLAFLAGAAVAFFFGVMDSVFGGRLANGFFFPIRKPIWLDMIETFSFTFLFLLVVLLLVKRNVFPRSMICPQCGNAKNDNGDLTCTCGGKFEPLTHYRWEKENKENTRQ
jgi:hypothetical protein